MISKVLGCVSLFCGFCRCAISPKNRTFVPMNTLFARLGISLALLSVLFFAACEKTGTASDAENGTAAAGQATADKKGSNGPKTQSVPEDKRSNLNKFPYVELAGGKSLRFEAYDIVFQLTHNKPLFPLTNDQVKWIKQDDADEKMGNFITYVYERSDGAEISLSNPYISVQYFARNSPDCEPCRSPQTVLKSFRDMYKTIAGFKAGPIMDVATNEGKMAVCQELYIPSIKLADGTGIKDDKYVAYAYIEYSDKWMVGFALTTPSKGEFDRCKNPFYDLVTTYAETGNFTHLGPK